MNILISLYFLQHISDRLTARLNECSDISTRYSDFLSLVQSEEMYIKQIEDKLDTEYSEAVDAEDMAAEMDVSWCVRIAKYSVTKYRIPEFRIAKYRIKPKDLSTWFG